MGISRHANPYCNKSFAHLTGVAGGFVSKKMMKVVVSHVGNSSVTKDATVLDTVHHFSLGQDNQLRWRMGAKSGVHRDTWTVRCLSYQFPGL